MKRIVVLLSVVFLLIALNAAQAQSQGHADLRWAKSLMERGDFAYAVEKFTDIAKNSYNSAEVRKEAFYYIGFCHVKNNDPWQAVRVFERFLEKYDDGISREFVPDALYVLGRVYEETGDRRAAIRVYRRCRQNYPGNSYGRKAAERLRELNAGGSGNTDPFEDDIVGGGNHHDDNHHHGGGNHGSTGISREIRQLLRSAEMVSNSFTRDQMLLDGVSQARSGEDMVALAKAIENDFSRSQLLSKASKHPRFSDFSTRSMIELSAFINNSYSRDLFLVELAKNMANRDYVSNYEFVDVSAAIENDMVRQQVFNAVEKSPAFKLMSARTVVDLAKTCSNSYISDQFLLSAAKNCPLSYRECMILAEACDNAYIQSQIAQIAKNKGSSGGGYHHRGNEKPVRIPQIVAEPTDPFDGFNFNKAQLERVDAFIKAVESRKNMKQAFNNLMRSDMHLATVREYVDKYRSMQNFNEAHRRQR